MTDIASYLGLPERPTAQIADQVGVSRMPVSRLISRSLATLRRHHSDDSAF
ncbi:sigma factor-like helix-turn-helix DNA-binding protein [Micromonospora sp. B9E7]|uniref:sigma factor-like helix-turn-helix DNA-binding protein n=1 Tax=Micromonospora sp. B9E7 TaxID=3153574 RepID=UPI00325D00D0